MRKRRKKRREHSAELKKTKTQKGKLMSKGLGGSLGLHSGSAVECSLSLGLAPHPAQRAGLRAQRVLHPVYRAPQRAVLPSVQCSPACSAPQCVVLPSMQLLLSRGPTALASQSSQLSNTVQASFHTLQPSLLASVQGLPCHVPGLSSSPAADGDSTAVDSHEPQLHGQCCQVLPPTWDGAIQGQGLHSHEL